MRKQSGFSLVELSIVLVILGLLVGGVLGGQSLIRAAELRAVSGEYQSYVSSVSSFRDKYFALPGDMPNATIFWGKDATNCNADTGVALATGTCNGSGDGIINLASVAGGTGEMFQFWRQLASAGMIEGTYTGSAGPAGIRNSIIGTNVPRSRVSNGGWSVSYAPSTWPGDAAGFTGELARYENHFRFGAQHPSELTQNVILRPEEAWNIDVKLDDGLPAGGNVIAYRWSTCTTALNNADATAVYRLDSNTLACALFVRLNQ